MLKQFVKWTLVVLGVVVVFTTALGFYWNSSEESVYKDIQPAKTGNEIVKEFEGEFEFLPNKNKYTAVTTKNGKTAFHFIDPLEPTDGSMYGFMLEAIPLIYKNDTSDYFGGKMELYKLPNGTNALAMMSSKYRYLALHVRMSDIDKRAGAVMFWREEI